MSIKVIEPIQNALKCFKSISDFNEYYTNHKDEMNSQTTHKLNKMYEITDGNVKYCISKVQGELSLKRKYYPPNTKETSPTDFNERLVKLEEITHLLSEKINEIIISLTQDQ